MALHGNLVTVGVETRDSNSIICFYITMHYLHGHDSLLLFNATQVLYARAKASNYL